MAEKKLQAEQTDNQQLEAEKIAPLDVSPPSEADDNVKYPTGIRLIVIVTSLCMALFLCGLVSSASPSKGMSQS